MKKALLIAVLLCFAAIGNLMAQTDSLQTTGSKLTIYKNFIRQGDSFYEKEDYQQATQSYKKALEVMPGDRYANYKLEDANTMFELKRDDEAYQQAIQAADALFEQTEYLQSKGKYEEALSIRPDEKYPKRKIKEIEGLLANSDKIQKQKDKTDKAYADFIRQADVTFDKNFYEASRNFYQQALGVKPNEGYPRQRIAEIDKILEDRAKEQANLRIINEQYRKLIEQADNQFSTKQYSEARPVYQQASELKSTEKYPKSQIKLIDSLMAIVEVPESKKQEPVVAVIPEQPKSAKTIEKTAKPESITVKSDQLPAKQAPIVVETEQLPEPIKMLAEKPAEKVPLPEKNAENPVTTAPIASTSPEGSRIPTRFASEPKAKEIVPDFSKENQSRIVETEKKYLMFIAAGDQSFLEKNLKDARANYVNAAQVKPSENYPKQKIAEIDGLLAAGMGNLMNALAENDPYYIAIRQADEAFAAEELNVASFYYRKAHAIRGFEKYPVSRLELIVQMKENLRLAKIEQNYQVSISKGDEFFAIQEYPSSKHYFRQALAFKPEALYPKSRLQDIDEALRMRKKDNRQGDFESYKKQGFIALQQNELSVAEYFYEKALYLKASDKEVNDQLDEIYRRKNTVADMDKADQYQRAIRTADEHFDHKSYQSARYFYLKALEFKTNDEYAKSQLEKISN